MAKKPAVEDEVAGPRRQTSFARFLRDVIIVCLLLAGGVYLYNKHITTKNAVNKLARSAQDKLKKDDLASLKSAEALCLEIIELDADNASGLAALAEIYFRQSEHGIDTLSKAKEYLSKAVAAESQSPSRFATAAYIKVKEGNATQAELDVKALLDQGLGSPKLAHAFGTALAAQGKFINANRVIRQAQDSDFSAVAYRLTLAEIAHRQGQERAASKHLGGAVANNMNANHHLAVAWRTAVRLKNVGTLTGPAKSIEKLRKEDEAGNLSPKAKAYLAWAETELALALGNPSQAKKDIEKALAAYPSFPPFLEAKARAMLLSRKRSERNEGMEIYSTAAAGKPEYRGAKWALAREKTKRRDDSALTLVDELESSALGLKGPEFEIFRGEHYLRKGDFAQAKAAFTKAADLGDDPAILFGLAKVTFEEESKKGKRADMDKVSEAFTAVNERRSRYPELHAYLGKISLWNYVVEAANASYETAEKHYKTLKRPIPEVFAFYDRTAREFRSVKERRIKKKARAAAQMWGEKKKQYAATLLTE